MPHAMNLQNVFYRLASSHLKKSGSSVNIDCHLCRAESWCSNAGQTYQRRQDGEEDGGSGGVAGHLRYRGDDDAGDADRGQYWQLTQRCQQLGHPQRQARFLQTHTP